MLNALFFPFRVIGNPYQKRFFFRWFRSLGKSYLLNQAVPWLTFEAIDYLNSLPLRGKRVFEYGSGGSTLFWVRKGSVCVSVEHDRSWYYELNSRLKSNPYLDYRLCEAEISHQFGPGERDPANPDHYASAAMPNHDFKRYVTQIDEFDDNFFDVVLIDGRARASCIKHCARKVAKEGILILDNADLDYYTSQAFVYLSGFSKRRLSGVGPSSFVFWQTDIYSRGPTQR